MSPPERILFVEDEEDFLFSLKAFFEEIYIVDTAENGVVALDKIISHEYDLIVMDIQMPFMKGNEAITQIKSSKPDQKVIGFTGISDEGLLQSYADLGFAEIIQKPINLKALSDIISRHLKGEGPLPPPPISTPSKPLPQSSSSSPATVSSEPTPVSDNSESLPRDDQKLFIGSSDPFAKNKEKPSLPVKAPHPVTSAGTAPSSPPPETRSALDLPPELLVKKIDRLEKENADLIEEVNRLEIALRKAQLKS